MLSILIDGVDRSSIIKFGSVSKEDNLNQRVDVLKFAIETHAGQLYKPEANFEIEASLDGTVIFKGIITEVIETVSDGILRYEVQCSDYTVLLDRKRPAEVYENDTVENIIADLVARYAPDFTTNNVNCDFFVKSVTFNRIPFTDCLQKLSSMTNFQWYVDYDKNIHFFEKSAENAPFNLSDDSGNYIFSSLKISNSLNQMRNRVFVRGGEAEGVSRTETYSGDGARKTFPLANKFSSVPTVTVTGAAKTVGVDYLDNEADFQCFWNFQQKYIRFKDTTIPAAGANNIVITGTPLFPVVAQVEEPNSIEQYGEFEFAKTDKTIKSKGEAKALAVAELQEHSSKVFEGSFQTYVSGLRSGQIITINSVQRNINQQFLIQRVRFKQVSKTKALWEVGLATWRTIGIIDYLINQLKTGDRVAEDISNEVVDKISLVLEEVKIAETVVASKVHNLQHEDIPITETVTLQELNYPVEFVAGSQDQPDGYKRQFILNGSRLG